jgi:hypothetical protein
MPEGAVYVGRPSRWGNPWRVRRRRIDLGAYVVRDAALATERFRDRLAALAPLGWFEPLRGRDLACWCPEACGEDVDLGWGEFGGPYDPCALPRGHSGHHDPSAPPYCHADVLLELANPARPDRRNA